MFLGSSENAGSLEAQDYRTRCGDYPQPTGFVKISRGKGITLIFNFTFSFHRIKYLHSRETH